MVLTTYLPIIIAIIIQQPPATDANLTECPSDCRCNRKTFSVDCSDEALQSLPADIPPDTTHLDLSNNLLQFDAPTLTFTNSTLNATVRYGSTSLPDLLENSDNLTLLDLSSNRIHTSILGRLHHSASLQHLALSHNAISQLFDSNLNNSTSSDLISLDLKGNSVSNLTTELFTYFPNLLQLWADGNAIRTFTVHFSQGTAEHPLRLISLSHNLINYLDAETLKHFPALQVLDLSRNRLTTISGIWSKHCSSLVTISLSHNLISHISKNSFHTCNNLTNLDLTGSTGLTEMSGESFSGLQALRLLNISVSSLQVIYAGTFSHLQSLEKLDISHNQLQTLYENTFPLDSSTSIYLNGNPWRCDCAMKWMQTWLKTHLTFVSPLICSLPEKYTAFNLTDLTDEDLNCQSAQIINYTHTAYLKIGSSATLDCIVSGNPRPRVRWTTPQKQVFEHYPDTEYTHGSPSSPMYHQNHYWHNNSHYLSQRNHGDHRIHVLHNASLFIDYVTRMDPGRYVCHTQNDYGNQTSVVYVTLDYLLFLDATFWSMSIGVACAGVFLLFGLTVCIVRIISTNCSKAEKEKRQGMVQVLHNLNDYRTAKVGQFTAYKTAKLDQLSAFKNAKVGKLRTYKQATLQSVLQHMQTLQEHYTSQIGRVKENCSQQVEKLRENYGNQASKFKTYKCSQVGRLKGYKAEKMDKLKEHYSHQTLKIKEYGSAQMTKLREQYKLQQQHLLKLLELLDIGHCMSAIEAECMRTDSMLFNDHLMNLDLDTCPVHVVINLSDTDNDDSAEYVTATSNSDLSTNNSDIPENHPDLPIATSSYIPVNRSCVLSRDSDISTSHSDLSSSGKVKDFDRNWRDEYEEMPVKKRRKKKKKGRNVSNDQRPSHPLEQQSQLNQPTMDERLSVLI